MRPSFFPRLVNGPFDDPGLFIPFQFEKRAILFDIGDISSLSSRDILKISHVFVSHTHMDHFIGFDTLLRFSLGRAKSLSFYGPEGFIKNVEGKLAAYSWNLLQNYSNRLTLKVSEIRQDGILEKEYACEEYFSSTGDVLHRPFNDCLLHDPAFKVSTLFLEHGIPCLGFAMKEQFHVNIKKDTLDRMGIEIGPWLAEFKQALYLGHHLDDANTITTDNGASFNLKTLAGDIAIITPGQKITYIADAACNETGLEQMVEFAKNSDYLFIEAAFLEKDRDIAQKKHHLTARQSGEIAGKAGAKIFEIFHFSPRYTGMEEALYEEARQSYMQHKAGS